MGERYDSARRLEQFGLGWDQIGTILGPMPPEIKDQDRAFDHHKTLADSEARQSEQAEG